MNDHKSRYTIYASRYTDVDFRPSTDAGWRAVYLLPESGFRVRPIAGWMLQMEDVSDFTSPTLPDKMWRGVVAAVIGEDGWLEAVNRQSDFWCLLAPGEPDPLTEVEIEVRAHRAYENAQLEARMSAKQAAL